MVAPTRSSSRRYAAASTTVQRKIREATRSFTAEKELRPRYDTEPRTLGKGWYDPEDETRIQFKECEINGVVFQRGDCLEIRNPPLPAHPHVARVVDILQKAGGGRGGKGGKNDSKNAIYFEIDWFYRPHDIPKSLLPKDAKPRHLCLGTTGDEHRVAGDEKKATVLPHWEYEEDEMEGSSTYVVHHVYDTDTRKNKKEIRPLTEEEWRDAIEQATKCVIGRYVDDEPKEPKPKKQKTEVVYDSDDEPLWKRSRKEEEEEIDSSEDEYKPKGSDGESENSKSEGEEVVLDDDSDLDSGYAGTARKKRKGAARKVATPKPKAAPVQKRKGYTPKKKTQKVVVIPEIKRNTAGETVYEQARMKLHVSAVPDTMPCREDEFAEIQGFVEGKIVNCESGSMYISGVPGTGKTATVHEVMRRLQASAESGDLPTFRFVEINGMRLTEPLQAYSKVWELLTGEQVTPKHALDLLETYFTTPSPRRECIVLLVDELDQLIVGNKHNVMYQFFNWPMSEHARLVVLTIANTMDLPDRMLSQKVGSRLGLHRLTFEPYTYAQLCEIIGARLEGLNIFKPEAINLCTRKIAAASGDARRALDICRYATEIAEAKAKSGNANAKVGLEEIDTVIKRMFTSSWVQAITNCSYHERLFLAAVLLEFKNSGIEEAVFGRVASRHMAICDNNRIPKLPTSALTSVCGRLAGMRLIISENPHTGSYQRIRLNLDPSELDLAIRNDTGLPKLLH
eukprot:comp19413_c0_seq1/m.22492 comp19413_c0_seq1/g.22492  ORF comp19413_c0_seq1/g.22492 comp19413_c0_seq1/m.22492 type:complete len:737 (-) comp19413_c0_seq1:607-2817(-)